MSSNFEPTNFENRNVNITYKCMGKVENPKILALEKDLEKALDEIREKAILRGEQNKTNAIVKNLLNNTDFDVARIAALTNCSESFVENVREDLERNK